MKYHPGKKQGHVDALSKLPVQVLTKDRRPKLNKTQTWDAMKRIHKEGHLGRRKALRMFRRRFQGVKENEICRKMIQGCQGCPKGTDYSP